ncbi:MAG TPA: prephenate dehydrogenase/arogenate dehydrogenase family protein, partial [Actinomycetota bacterium]|nr:prephenate dehydrogenase/arogenate dehydrogenase family protein [Actinomycetota bacterium]
CGTTSMPPPEGGVSIRRVAIIGTGLIGTSIAMAARRAGADVVGWDLEATVLATAAAGGTLTATHSLEAAATDADLVVVATPIGAVPATVRAALAAAPAAIVTDAASIKTRVIDDVRAQAPADALPRFVPGHPMGGSERSGPEHASASVVDGIVWVLAPSAETDPGATQALQAWVEAVGAKVVVMDPERHDRLVAVVSHLPQVASTTLMGTAADREAGEQDALLLAAGGFRDLTRLAASQPALWSEILVANREEVAAAIDLFVRRLEALRDRIAAADAAGVESTFDAAKQARLGLAAKPTVRSGVAVWQVEIPDEPGALARITAVLGTGGVNIEDLQIVHSPEGGRGTVHLTVAADTAASAADVLASAGYDPTRLA